MPRRPKTERHLPCEDTWRMRNNFSLHSIVHTPIIRADDFARSDTNSSNSLNAFGALAYSTVSIAAAPSAV